MCRDRLASRTTGGSVVCTVHGPPVYDTSLFIPRARRHSRQFLTVEVIRSSSVADVAVCCAFRFEALFFVCVERPTLKPSTRARGRGRSSSSASARRASSFLPFDAASSRAVDRLTSLRRLPRSFRRRVRGRGGVPGQASWAAGLDHRAERWVGVQREGHPKEGSGGAVAEDVRRG